MVADLKVESISTVNHQQQEPICLPETFLGWAKGKPQKKRTSYYQDGRPEKLSTHHSMPFKHTVSKLPHEDPSLLSPLPLCLQHALCRLFPRFFPATCGCFTAGYGAPVAGALPRGISAAPRRPLGGLAAIAADAWPQTPAPVARERPLGKIKICPVVIDSL